ncbi:MAG: SH3 domain-containing protein [Candidatus Sungbacteria bacterium]|nr:SH3 domain-containing protein [Candidatus Sungbacteria bacterium]
MNTSVRNILKKLFGTPLAVFTLIVTAFLFFPHSAHPQTPLFQNSDIIKTTANLNVRANPSLSGALLGTQPMDSSGIIVLGGPITADGYIWWNINYDNAPDGWSVQDYLTKVSSPSPTPSPQPIPTPSDIETAPKVTSDTTVITQTCDQLSNTTSQGYCWQTKAIVDGNPSLCDKINVTADDLSRSLCLEALNPPRLPFTLTISPDQYELGDTVAGQVRIENPSIKTILSAFKVEFFHESTLYSTENTPLNLQPSTTTMLSLDDLIGESTLSTLPEGSWILRFTQVSATPANTAESSFTIGEGKGGCSVSKALIIPSTSTQSYASTTILTANELGIPLLSTRFLACDYGQGVYNQPPFGLNGYDGIIFFQNPSSGGVNYDSIIRLPTTTPIAFMISFFHDGGGSTVNLMIEKGSTTAQGISINPQGGGSNVTFKDVLFGTTYKSTDTSGSNIWMTNGTTTKQIYQGIGQFP